MKHYSEITSVVYFCSLWTRKDKKYTHITPLMQNVYKTILFGINSQKYLSAAASQRINNTKKLRYFLSRLSRFLIVRFLKKPKVWIIQ